VAVLLCKTLLRYAPISNSLMHHPLGKDQLIPPVKVGLQEANCTQLVHKNVVKDLLQKDR
jgi:hypothetical protein